jgi:hypothetical protein
LPDVETVAPGALDRFRLDLVEAGFRTADGRVWRGPVEPSVADLTTAGEMTIAIDNGWPFRHPHVYIAGLKPSVHLQGEALCLWRVGDDSLAWLRLGDLRARIALWTERYRGRATLEDPILDPHLYWTDGTAPQLVTLDLSSVSWGNGGSGSLRATRSDTLVEVGARGDLHVRWYGRTEMRHPPVNLAMVAEGLKAEQARNLERELERAGRPGGMDMLLLIWQTPAGEPDVLALSFSRDAAGVLKAKAHEVARTDTEVLLRRAGPDAAVLQTRSVVVFGQGSVGSNVSMLLARSGLGRHKGVDSAKIRPGDVVRHAGSFPGYRKAIVVAGDIARYAPWTVADFETESTWDPAAIRAIIGSADLVVDAVGEASFTEGLNRALAGGSAPLLSIALYRGGALARARLWIPGGIAIHERESEAYPPIAAGDGDDGATWETGCASPVNNAPPVSVVSAAALASRIAVEVLVGREDESVDVVEVYRPIEAPFDRPTSLRFGGRV